MRFAETLVDGYDENADITWLLQHTEIHSIVYVNPDGRNVAENYPDEYWRKNIDPKAGCSSGYGVDINRNFDFMWGDLDGASDNPCDEDYHGKSADSEPETQAVVNYARGLFPEGQRKENPKEDRDVPVGEDISGMFVDVHSSGGYGKILTVDIFCLPCSYPLYSSPFFFFLLCLPSLLSVGARK